MLVMLDACWSLVFGMGRGKAGRKEWTPHLIRTRVPVACRSFYTHPPPTYTPHYPLQLPFTPPGSSQPIPYLEIPLEIPLAPGLVPMRGEVAAPPAIGPPRDKP